MYQVGRANDPDPNDPRFEDLAQAMAHARHECVGESVIGVWNWDGDHPIVVCLIYQGDVYTLTYKPVVIDA